MRLPWVGVGYGVFSSEPPPTTRRLVVRAQGLRFRNDTRLPPPSADVEVEVTVGQVGKTSIEMLYTVRYDGVVVADAVATMVCVSGAAGAFKPSQVPERVRKLAASAATPSPAASAAGPTAAEGASTQGGAVTMDQAYTRRVLATVKGIPPKDCNAFTYPFTVRFSDEDVNRHTNHAGYARFCCDAVEELRASTHPLAAHLGQASPWFVQSIVLEYVAETKARDALTAHLWKGEGAMGELLVVISRGDTVCTKGVLQVTTGPGSNL